jgi:ABC-type transport system involved in multi-copper enzyme maturation permease subunit
MGPLIVSELRQRIRGKRWWILLVLWTLLLTGFTALVRAGAKQASTFSGIETSVGPIMFGSLVLFLLGLSTLVVPALTSTSINGERDRGTLAVLQSTMWRPGHIALAKFVAAMIIGTAFLMASLPLVLWAASEGGVQGGRAAIVYVLLFLIFALFAAIGLAASAMIRKTSLATLASYGVVFLLTVGSPILFGLSLAGAPQESTFQRQVGWRWALLAPNPFVVVADAAPRGGQPFNDPLEGIRQAVREARRPPLSSRDGMSNLRFDPQTGEAIDLGTGEPLRDPPALWPTGMLIDAALIALAAYIVMDRLKVPARKLRMGERVA